MILDQQGPPRSPDDRLREELSELRRLEREQGASAPEVGRALLALADAQQSIGRDRDAEESLWRAVRIAQDAPGTSDLLHALDELARLSERVGKLQQAESLLRRSLATVEAELGPSHAKVATRLNNLAALLQKTPQKAEAERLYRRSLEIVEASFGPRHPKVATRLSNLALLLQSTGRPEEALELFWKALDIEERLGPERPEVAVTLNNLAGLLLDLGRHEKAIPMFRRVLSILLAVSRTRGRRHPHLVPAADNYVRALRSSGMTKEQALAEATALLADEGVEGEPDDPLDTWLLGQ